MRGCRRGDDRGFSLLELSIASGIFLLSLAGIVTGLVSTTSLAQASRDRGMAVNDARQVLEQIWDTPFSEVTTTNWSTWVTNNCCAGLSNELVTVTVADPNADPLQVTVAVTWQTGARPLSISLVTLRTRD